MALEDAGIAILHLVGRRAERDCPRDIRGAVEILRARIKEIKRSGIKRALGLCAGPIMNDRAVGTGARDRVETQPAKALAFGAEGFEPVRSLDLAQG